MRNRPPPPDERTVNERTVTDRCAVTDRCTVTDRRTFSLALAALGAIAALPASARAGNDSAVTGPIIISGASGHLGELAVRDLLGRGVPASRLILVSRTPAQLESYAKMGASVRFGDFTKPESLRQAFAGGKQMLLISIGFGPMPRPVAHKYAIDAAVANGVQHIAYTSWIALSRGDQSGLGVDHFKTEQTLRESGVAWTMLRNSIYMEAVLPSAQKMLAAGSAPLSRDDLRIAYVAREDCAAAAAAVLATPGHDDKAYDITGPQLIDTRELAATLTAVTGKPIRIVPSHAAPRRGLYGGPAVAVVSDAVARLTGRPAMTLKTFFERHRAELQSGPAHA